MPSHCTYDAFSDSWTGVSVKNGIYHLHLEPYGSIAVSDTYDGPMSEPLITLKTDHLSLNEWNITLHEIGKDTSALGMTDCLEPISGLWPDFSGLIDYTAAFELQKKDAKIYFRGEYVFECMEVFVNGTSAGKRITPPYMVDITDPVREGHNEIVVKIATTPLRNANTHPGIFGKERTIIEPTGMFGKTEIIVNSI